MLHIWGIVAVLGTLTVSHTASADSSLSNLSVLNQAIQLSAANQPTSGVDAHDSQMEAGFCAPGMACHASAARSQQQLPALQKVAIFVEDRRKPVAHPKGSELAPIGALVNRTTDEVSTTFLVGECHILTTAHSVVGTARGKQISYDPRKDDFRKALAHVQMEFHVGQTGTRRFADVAKATIENMGKFNPLARDDEEDWALLRLSDCLGRPDKYGYFELFDAELEKVQGKTGIFRAAGFPGEPGPFEGVWEDPKCTVHGRAFGFDDQTNVWATDCNLVRGQSGSPIIRKGLDGKIYVFGIATSQVVATKQVIPGFSIMDANRMLSSKAFIHAVRKIAPPSQLASRQ